MVLRLGVRWVSGCGGGTPGGAGGSGGSGGSGASPCSTEKRFAVVIFSAGLTV